MSAIGDKQGEFTGTITSVTIYETGTVVTFEEDQVYDQRDAEGFIKLNALRLRLLKRRG